MRPLVFLTARTVVNSVRRALQSPTRLIGVVFILAWWFMIVMGQFVRPSRPETGMGAMLDLPKRELIYALMFAAFLVIFAIRALTMFRVPGLYRPADVDMLFPTPVSPGLVLMHRFLFDYLITLLIPLLLVVFSGRRGAEGIEMLFKDLPDPSVAPLVGKTILIGFLLVSLFGVAVSYAVGLYINRDSDRSRLARRLVGWGLALGGVVLAAAVGDALRSPDFWARLIEIPNSTIVRGLLYPIAGAADLAIAPLYATLAQGVAGGLFLLIGSGLLLWFSVRQAGHLYDMAARRTASMRSRREASMRGDMTLLLVQSAREGKLKPRSIRWLSDRRPQGWWAILWREATLSYRTSLGMLAFMALLAVILSAMPMLAEEKQEQVALVFFPIQLLMVISISIGMSQNGFQETLRRVDIQKPLPFSSRAMCAMEILGKSLGPIFVAFAAASTSLVLRPQDWDYGLALAIALPSVAVIVVAAQLLIVLQFPDAVDPTQRAFRGLLQFLGSVIVVLPGFLIALPLVFLEASLLLVALVGVAVNAGVAVILTAFAAPLYAGFNPSD